MDNMEEGTAEQLSSAGQSLPQTPPRKPKLKADASSDDEVHLPKQVRAQRCPSLHTLPSEPKTYGPSRSVPTWTEYSSSFDGDSMLARLRSAIPVVSANYPDDASIGPSGQDAEAEGQETMSAAKEEPDDAAQERAGDPCMQEHNPEQGKVALFRQNI